RGRDRLPSQRSRKEVKEPERRKLDARETLRDSPELSHAPEKVSRRIGGEKAMDLPIELQTPSPVGLAPRRLERPVHFRILGEADVLAVRRSLARMEIRVLIEVGRQEGVRVRARFELPRFHALRVSSPIERAELDVDTDLLVALFENLRDVRINRCGGRI